MGILPNSMKANLNYKRSQSLNPRKTYNYKTPTTKFTKMIGYPNNFIFSPRTPKIATRLAVKINKW